MSAIVYYPCTKFEQNRSSHVWVMATVCEKTKWPPVGHIGSYHKTNPFSDVSHSVLCMYQVWTETVMPCLCNGCSMWKKTKWPPVGHIGSYRKTNLCSDVSHSVLCLYQVWTELVKPWLCNGWKYVKKQNGRQSAILDHIAKQIHVQMSVIVYYACTKYEQNRSSHVWVMAESMWKNKMAASRPYWIILQNKSTCICKP